MIGPTFAGLASMVSLPESSATLMFGSPAQGIDSSGWIRPKRSDLSARARPRPLTRDPPSGVMPTDPMPSVKSLVSGAMVLALLAGAAVLAYARWTDPIAEGDREIAEGSSSGRWPRTAAPKRVSIVWARRSGSSPATTTA